MPVGFSIKFPIMMLETQKTGVLGFLTDPEQYLRVEPAKSCCWGFSLIGQKDCIYFFDSGWELVLKRKQKYSLLPWAKNPQWLHPETLNFVCPAWREESTLCLPSFCYNPNHAPLLSPKSQTSGHPIIKTLIHLEFYFLIALVFIVLS